MNVPNTAATSPFNASQFAPSTDTPIAQDELVRRLTAVRLADLRKRLDAPTHAPIVNRATSYAVDIATGEVSREDYCETCHAWDVSRSHRAAGHRTSGGAL